MVSATPSGGWLQSSPVIPGLGFLLAPARRCSGSRKVCLIPHGGKRPRTTLTPSLVLREGEPYLAFGTPGGDQQDQWSPNFFLSHVHFGLNLQEAIDAPNFHTEHFPSLFYPRTSAPGKIVVEDRLEPDVFAGLRARGHDVDVVDGWSLGRLSAVSRNTRDGSPAGRRTPGACRVMPSAGKPNLYPTVGEYPKAINVSLASGPMPGGLTGGWSALTLRASEKTIIIFAVNLGILPASGYVPLFQDPIANITVMILPILATGLRSRGS